MSTRQRFFSILALVMLIIIAFIPLQVQAQGIRVFIDGTEIKFDVLPVIENGRTLVPMRAIFEALGAEIQWDKDTQTAAAFKGDIGIAVQVGNSIANVNNEAVKLDAAPKIIGGRTMVPLRFVSEALGCKVEWDGKTSTVTITSVDSVDITNETTDFVGLWSSNSKTGGSTVDPFGNITGVYYSGEWYLFKEDGTFRHIIIGSGSIISGSVLLEGKYSCESNVIRLYDLKETWTPYPNDPSRRPAYKNKSVNDREMEYELQNDGEKLILDNFTTTFYKVNM